jgi:PhoH-like ATPase
MSKTYVLDTNVLLSDSNAINSFEDNTVVLPLIVIEELDRHKDRQDEVGRNARETSRKLTALIAEHKDLRNGIPLFNGGTLRVLSAENLGTAFSIPPELDPKSGDNVIIAFCKAFQVVQPDLILISRDLLLRLKAEALGIPCEDYKKLSVADSVKSLYTGVETLDGIDVNEFYSPEGLVLSEEASKDLFSNEFLVLQDGTGRSALGRYMAPGKPIKALGPSSVDRIQARNKEQKFALDLLLDPNVNLVTIIGQAGTGKTLLAIAAGLDQVQMPMSGKGAKGRYKSLVICRPIQPVGKDIGFLPGTMEEKMEPWIAPIKDNLRYLLSDGKKGKSNEEVIQYYFDQGVIEVEAMTFIRGRSIANAFMIIDEAQNLNVHELKTILTRAGEGTKIVLTGDIEQIDNMYVDSVSNGLTVAIEKFKEYAIAGHVTLKKGERSELATLAASIL